MTDNIQYIKVSFKIKNEWYIATSKQLPGLFMYDSSYDILKSILPEAIKATYGANGKKVRVEYVKPRNDVNQTPTELDYMAIAA